MLLLTRDPLAGTNGRADIVRGKTTAPTLARSLLSPLSPALATLSSQMGYLVVCVGGQPFFIRSSVCAEETR